MKKFLGINLNKNLAKKGTIIALALAVVIGMSYFGSQDYLNMSIMDMLMGDTGGYTCVNNDCFKTYQDSICPAVKKEANCTCTNNSRQSLNWPSEFSGEYAPSETEFSKVHKTPAGKERDKKISATNHKGETKELGYADAYWWNHDGEFLNSDGSFKDGVDPDDYVPENERSNYQVHHKLPVSLGGKNELSNLIHMPTQTHQDGSNKLNPQIRKYCHSTPLKR